MACSCSRLPRIPHLQIFRTSAVIAKWWNAGRIIVLLGWFYRGKESALAQTSPRTTLLRVVATTQESFQSSNREVKIQGTGLPLQWRRHGQNDRRPIHLHRHRRHQPSRPVRLQLPLRLLALGSPSQHSRRDSDVVRLRLPPPNPQRPKFYPLVSLSIVGARFIASLLHSAVVGARYIVPVLHFLSVGSRQVRIECQSAQFLVPYAPSS
jgi:hypothetical protein